MRRKLQRILIAVAFGFVVLAGGWALADDCVRLGGVVNAVPECVVSASVSRSNLTAPGGPYTIDETLRITSTGHITIPVVAGGNTLTLNITGGFIMEDGASISGNTNASDSAAKGATINITASGDITLGEASITSTQNAGSCNGGFAGNINLVSTGGNVIAVENSLISANANKCPAGDILITALPTGRIDLDGLVLSQSGATGNPGAQGGGKITVKAGCELLISDTGVLSSRSLDPSSDLVHLEGCVVVINGLVESTAHGHVYGGNSCNNDAAAHPIGSGPSIFFAGCVEVWSGTTITIDDTGGNNGQINADVTGVGGTQGRGWIDLFARGDITIIGDTGAVYAVHANGGIGANTDDGGLITVKSVDADVVTIAKAIQANSTGAGGKGGDVIVQAGSDVNFGTASIQAMGSNGGAPNAAGGHISARAFNGVVLGALPGELNADGGFGKATPIPGLVTLQGCGTGAPGDGVNYTGTVVPFPPMILADACGGSPELPAGVNLPPGNCAELCDGNGDGDCEKASVRSVLNPLTGRFPGNNGPDVVVRLDLGDTVQDAVDNATNVNGDPYLIILVVKDDTGKLGGSTTENVDISKDYSPDRFALVACSVTIKAADAGLPSGHVAQSAASVAGSPENIFVMDLHGANSGVAGWLVEGNGRYFRNVANRNNDTGIGFIGDGNTMHNGNAEGNSAVGIYVQGNGNLVDSSDSFDNGGHGIQVVGGGNTVDGTDVGDRGKGNDGDGINVAGNGNRILENDVFANLGNGIFVVGDSSTINKNDVGERGKENGLDGIHMEGSSAVLQENDALANFGDGFEILGNLNFLKKDKAGDSGDNRNGGDGFHLVGNDNSFEECKANVNRGDGYDFAGTGNKLKKSTSNDSGQGGSKENAGFEYTFANPVLDLTGNKKDNANFVGAGVPKTYAAGNYE